MNYLIKNKIVYMYEEPLCKNLDMHEIKDYIENKIGIDVEIRKEFISYHLPNNKIEYFAEKMAWIRVRDVKKFSFIKPLYGEIEYEKKMLIMLKRCSVLYDGFMLQMLLREMMPMEEYKHIHIVFTNRLFGTFDKEDKRYHARVIICGHPSLISTTGIVEAPAKPKEFYYLKKMAIVLGIPLHMVKENFKGKIIEYDDERMTEIMKGYVMQALMYVITGEAFCNDKNCRLFNAHWQEDIINSQLKGREFCERHEKIIEEIKREYG